MARIQQDQPQASLILVSTCGTIRDAVEMMRLGARGFVEWADHARLIDLVRQELEARSSAHLSTNALTTQARCQNILDEQVELICRYDADFRLTFVNRAYSAWWGQPPEVLIGTLLISHIPESDREQTVAHVKALNRDHATITALHRTTKPGGTEHIIEWTDRALFDESGRFLEYQGVGRDVTEREHQAAQLKALMTDLERQRNQLDSLLDTIQEAIFAVSLPDRQLLYASASVDKILGRSLHWVLENPDNFRQMVHPDDYERAVEAMRTCLREGYAELDLRIIWPDGQVRWLQRQAWLSFDNTGNPIQVIDAARDITVRKQAELALQRYARRLEILHEIDLGLIQGASIPDLLNTTCARLSTLFECEEAVLF
ncbi:MAG: PAS domain-containing protein [Anaerolineae bacterium]